MNAHRIIVGLDVGSSEIRTVVSSIDENSHNPSIIGVGTSEALGFRKGLVIDVEEAVTSISKALEEAERISGEPIHSVFLGVGGHHLQALNSKGVVAISNPSGEIFEEDIDRSLEAAQAMSIPPNRKILRIIPQSFSVDEQTGIKYPVGMNGIRLEVDAHIVTGLTPCIRNLEKCVINSGVDIEDMIPNNLAAGDGVLTKRQKELGVATIDIGHGTTGVSVYEEGTILHTTMLPIGGENVTNDIAIGLKCSIDAAERIKLEFANCNPEIIDSKEMIDLSLISKIDMHQISRKTLCEIVQARYQEILQMVQDELEKCERDGMLPAGVVITGGGSKIPNILELARETLKLPVQIGFPQNFEGLVEKVDDPRYSTALGLVVWGARFSQNDMNFKLSVPNLDWNKTLDSVKDWFKNLMP